MTQAKKTETKEERTRTSLFLKDETIKSLKYMAFVSRTTQTDLIDQSINDFIKKWEKDNGPIPEKFLK